VGNGGNLNNNKISELYLCFAQNMTIIISTILSPRPYYALLRPTNRFLSDFFITLTILLYCIIMLIQLNTGIHEMRYQPRLTIAIPKQEKIKTPVLFFLEERGFFLSNQDGESGVLSDKAGNLPNIRVEFVRAADALLLLQEKVVDLAVIGSDVVDENTSGTTPRFLEPVVKSDLAIASCRFTLAVPDKNRGQFKKPEDLNGLRIATSYPNILQEWLDRNEVIPSRIIIREGGVESCVRLGLADAVADLVDTGKTLRKNNLVTAFDIARTSAKIYAPSSTNYMSQILADEFLRYILSPSQEKVPTLSLQVA
jgi:ATP phosphoribosyltransferase